MRLRVSPGRARRLLALWTTVLVLALMPWRGLQDHSHWYRVAWVPFVSPPVRPLDVAGNVALFVPFGYLFGEAAAGRNRRTLVVALVTAGLLSLGAETVQVYSHGRYPSATDFVANVAGAALGLRLARRAREADTATGAAAGD